MKQLFTLKIKSCFTLLFLLLSIAVLSQSKWVTISTGVDVVMHDIFFVDAKHGWFCGENKVIAQTKDGGESWTKVNLDVGNTIYSVFFVSANKGWAACDDGNILHTEDGGTTWTIQDTKPTYLLDVEFLDENTGWIFAGEGHIYYTTNGGSTWTEQPKGTRWTDCYDGYMISSQKGVTVGYSGFIFYTTNGGQTWTKASSSYGNNLEGVNFVDENTGWAVGEEILLKTMDGGKTWTKQKDFPDELVRDVYFKNSLEGWVVSYGIAGQGGKIYFTSDGGENWEIQEDNPSTYGFNAISYYNDQNIWIASDNTGIIAKLISENNSEPVFTEQTLPMPDGLTSESNFGAAVAISVDMAVVTEPDNAPGYFHVYKKNESNWELMGDPVGIPWGDPGLDALGGSIDISGTRIIAGSYGAGMGFEGKAAIWNVEDNSVNHEATLQAPEGEGFIFGFYGYNVSISGDFAVVGQRNGGALGGSAYIYERNTIDNSWPQVKKLSLSDANGGEFFGHSVGISGNRIIVGAPNDSLPEHANAGSVYIFEKNGDEWIEMTKLQAESPSTSGNFGHAVDIYGDYAVVAELNQGSGKIYIYHYNDESWDLEISDSDLSVTINEENLYTGLSVSISGMQVVVGADNSNGTGAVTLLTKSADVWNKTTIMADNLNAGDGFGFSVSVFGDKIAVGAPSSGMGVAYIFEESSVSTNIENNILTESFSLYQNYPNPFDRKTTISFNLEKQSQVQLTVFDLQGRTVKVLINEKFPAGKHEQVFNAEDLPDGLYFCTLSANGNTQTKKLILSR